MLYDLCHIIGISITIIIIISITIIIIIVIIIIIIESINYYLIVGDTHVFTASILLLYYYYYLYHRNITIIYTIILWFAWLSASATALRMLTWYGRLT